MEPRCPVCHKTIKTSAKKPTEQSPFFPFCSRRCKLIDLGAWLDVEYKIASESQSDESEQLSHDIHRNSDKE
ncbi:DNA gyrase inhibitor YacG [Planctomycetota bacterium]